VNRTVSDIQLMWGSNGANRRGVIVLGAYWFEDERRNRSLSAMLALLSTVMLTIFWSTTDIVPSTLGETS
jgi:hypothetical protein